MKIKIQTGNKPYLSLSKRISKSSKLAVLKYGFLLFCSSMNLLAQSENVGIGTNTPDNSAVLDVNFSNPTYPKGLLIPRLTSSDRGNISLPAKGLIIFNTTTNKFEYNSGTPASPNWLEIFSSGNLGLTQNYIFVGNASNQAIGVALSGDATITSAGAITIANSAITSAKISDGTITDSDINSSAAIAYSKLSLSNSIVAGDITSDAVTSAKILDGTISNGDISSSAAITVTKLANGTNNQILRTNGTTPEWWTPDYANGSTTLVGDVTGTLGATTIATGAVTSAKIADGTITNADINASAAIAYSKLSLSNSIVAGDITSDAVTSAKILDGTISNTDISGSAAITVTKLANGTNNQILRTNGTTPEWWTPNYADASTSLVGDVTGTIGANTIATGAVTSTKIADGTITNADISGTAAIAYSKLSLTGTIVAGDLAADAVTTAKILDGNVTSAKIADATIANADISTTAGIAVTKLANGTANQILRTNGTSTPEWWTADYITSSDVGTAVVGGDLSGTVSNAQIISGAVGTSEIADGTITNTDINASAGIAYSKLSLTGSISNTDINASAGIAVTKLANGTANQILRTNGTSTPEWWTPDYLTNSATLTGDVTGTLSANTIANNTITSAKIVDATITDADLSTSGVVANTYGTATKVAQVTVNDKGRVTAVSEVTIAGVSPTNSALTNSHIWVGDATNTAKVVAISGDIDLAANGTVLIQGDAITSSKILNGTIANVDISTTAGIAVTKLANGTDAQILRTNGTTPEWWTPNYTTSADVSATVVGGDLSGTVANSQIIAGAVGTSEIANGSITDTDINAGAGIAVTKLANGTSNQILRTNGTSIPEWWTPDFTTSATSLGGELGGTIANATINSNAITSVKILDGAVTSAKILDGTIANADINASAGIAYSKLALSGSITNTDINASAGIAVTKLANGTANQILRTNGTSTPEWWTPDYTTSSDISSASVGGDLTGTVANAQIASGAVGTNEIADASITNTDINAAAGIAYSKLALSGSITNADISTTAGIAVTKLANGTANQILRTNGTSTPEWWTPDYTTSADISAAVVGGDLSGTVANAQIISGAVGTNEIADASITNTDISASAAIAYSKLALTNSIVAGDITSDAVTTAKILDGNVTSAKIADATITNTDISTTAGIAVTKLANGTANQILRTNGTSTPEWWTPDYTTSSDISSASVGGDLTGTVANAQIASGSVGTAEITDGSITNTDISASAAIAYSKLALTNSIVAGDITSDAVTTAKILDGNVTSAKIADATIANADISTTAGIAVTKLANGTANQILRTNGTSTPEWWTPDYTTSSDISSASVGGDLTGTVANAQIASGAVGTAEITDASITNTDISASAAIAYSKLALTNSIVAGDITSDAITTVKILDGNVTSAKIADGTIANADINASAAIDASKLADGSVSNAEFQYLSAVTSDIQTQLNNKFEITGTASDKNTLRFNGTNWVPNSVISNDGTNVGIGTSTISTNLHVYESNTDVEPALRVEQASTGDAAMRFQITGTQDATIGVDNSDNDNIKITNTNALTGSTYSDANTMMRIHTESGNEGIIDLNHQSRARAYFNGTQNIPDNTWTKVNFDSENFDEKSEFDNSTNFEFTAKVDGYYHIDARVEFNSSTSMGVINVNDYVSIAIYKNNSEYSLGSNQSIGINGTSTQYAKFNNTPRVSDLVYLAAGDKIQIYAYQSCLTNWGIVPGSSKTYVSIHKQS